MIEVIATSDVGNPEKAKRLIFQCCVPDRTTASQGNRSATKENEDVKRWIGGILTVLSPDGQKQ